MAEFLRLPGSIINLSQIQEIQLESEIILVRWVSGTKSVFRGADAEALLQGLEQRYGVLTDPVALWRAEDAA